MGTIDRRMFLRVSGGAVAAAALAGPFQGLVAHAAGATGPGLALGPLSDRADLADGATRLALPPGYVYRSFGAAGDLMADGVSTPPAQDGMAAFRGPRNTIRVVRNHEVNGAGTPFGDLSKAYDEHTIGGTTTLEVHRHTRELLGDWVSLNGTSFNCAGGPTPWGTWLSVEETVNGPDVGTDFAGAGGAAYAQKHGYLFEVDSLWGPGEHATAQPIRDVGRMPHEAVALDPRTGFLYETEDQFLFPAGIYRYRAPQNPMRVRRLLDGGVLEMLRVKGATAPTVLGGDIPAGSTFEVDWATIPDPDFDGGMAANDVAIRTVSLQGFADNAAAFARPEGMWYHAGAIFFSCTSGGGADPVIGQGQYGSGRGQVWRLDPHKNLLTLLFTSNDPTILDLPDNLTVSSRGTIVLCEDGRDGNFVRLLSKDGQLSDFAQNRTGRPDDEFAGATISPDGRTLFVNIQSTAGRTFAIWHDDGGLRF